MKKNLKSKLSKSEKKLWFFLCWANEQPKEVFDLLSRSVLELKEEIKEQLPQFSSSDSNHANRA